MNAREQAISKLKTLIASLGGSLKMARTHSEEYRNVIGDLDIAEMYAKEALAALESDGWVKCSERLPEQDTLVLVADISAGVYAAWLNRNGRWTKGDSDGYSWSVDGTTHWSNLPSPPEKTE